MAVHNGERHLRPTLDSILAQTFHDFEFVIVNDGSTDGTQNILEEYRKRDSRIRVHFLESQCPGQAQPANVGVRISRGEFVARTDADDVSAPERLEMQLAFLEAHPDVSCVAAFSFLKYDDGARVDTWSAPESHALLKWRLCFGNVFAHSSVMFRRRAFEEIGGYNEERHYSEDYDLWCRLSRNSRLACLQRPLVTLNRHGASVTFRHRQVQLERHNTSAREHISALCGHPISENALIALHAHLYPGALRPPDARHGASAVVLSLYRKFLTHERLGEYEQTYIRRDAARRLWELNAPQAWRHLPLWPGLLQSCRLNPELPRDCLLRRLRPLFVTKNKAIAFFLHRAES